MYSNRAANLDDSRQFAAAEMSDDISGKKSAKAGT
jgi:hypothetical protein